MNFAFTEEQNELRSTAARFLDEKSSSATVRELMETEQGFDEGTWPQKAYWDALGRARQRDAGWYIDYGWTRPKVVSRGPAPQGLPTSNTLGESAIPSTTEVLPAAEPTPARPPAEATEPSPLPAPRAIPQETRSKPKAAPRAVVTTEPTDEDTIEPVATETGRVGQVTGTAPKAWSAHAGPPSVPRFPVAPAAHWTEVAPIESNPLRAKSTKPIGTGVE